MTFGKSEGGGWVRDLFGFQGCHGVGFGVDSAHFGVKIGGGGGGTGVRGLYSVE